MNGPDSGRDVAPEVVRARDRKANAAIQLRVKGCDWGEIAETLGYPTPRAALVATERALEKELRTESKEAMRGLAGKRLERLLKGVWSTAIDEHSPEQFTAVSRAREIIADHRKMFGLDAPTEVSMHSPAAGEIEAWVATVVTTGPMLEEMDIFGEDDDDTNADVVDAVLAEGESD